MNYWLLRDNSSSNIPILHRSRERIYPMVIDHRCLHRFTQLQEILPSLRQEYGILDRQRDWLMWEKVDIGSAALIRKGMGGWSQKGYLSDRLSQLAVRASDIVRYSSMKEVQNYHFSFRENSKDADMLSGTLSVHLRYRYTSSYQRNLPRVRQVAYWNRVIWVDRFRDNLARWILKQVNSMCRWGE